MPLPFIVALGIGALVGALVVSFWDEIKQLAIDFCKTLYRTVKKSKNALKMIALGFSTDEIFSGNFRLTKKGGKFLLETFLHEFRQTPSWKIWKKEDLEEATIHKETKVIDASEVPDEIKEKIKKNGEIQDVLELAL